MKPTKLIRIFKTLPLFEGLTRSELSELSRACTIQEVTAGHEIIVEGSLTNSIYFILDGEVEVLKRTEDLTSMFHITDLSNSCYFGEMSFIDGSERSSTVKSKKPSQILEISKDALMTLPNGEIIFSVLKFNIANRNSLFDRLRHANNTIVKTLQKEKELLEKQNRFGHFFIVIVAQSTIVMLVNHLIVQKLGINNAPMLYSYLFSWSYLTIVALPCVLYLMKTHQKASSYGVSLHPGKKTLKEIAIALLIIAILFMTVDQMQWISMPNFFSLGFLTYLIHSGIQEFVARGITLTSLDQFYGHKYKFLSVTISSLLFGITHIHFNMTAVLITFAIGMVLGYIFLHQRNILGVTLLHAILGYFAFNVHMI